MICIKSGNSSETASSAAIMATTGIFWFLEIVFVVLSFTIAPFR